MRVLPYGRAHLPSLLELVNLHLNAIVPGWALTEAYLAEHLERNADEYVTDPWVLNRTTLCALEGRRVLAAAHLLRYGDHPGVGKDLRDVGEISWLVFLPDREDAAAGVLARAREGLGAWRVGRQQAYGAGLPKMPLPGVPDARPHVASALGAAGYRPPRKDHRGALYGGRLDGATAPQASPPPGMTIRRTVGRFGTRFSAVLDGEELGGCECVADLGRGGALPALRGWAELSEV